MKDKFTKLAQAYGLSEKDATAVLDLYDWEWGSFDKADIVEELDKKRPKTKPLTIQAVEQESLLLFDKKSPFNVQETIVGRVSYYSKRMSGLSVSEAFDASIRKIEDENLKGTESWGLDKMPILHLNDHFKAQQLVKKTEKALKTVQRATNVCLFAGIIACMGYLMGKQQGKASQEPALKDFIHQEVSPKVIQKGGVPNHANMNENER